MIARAVAAIIELAIAADLRFKAAIRAAQEGMVLIPAGDHGGLVLRLGGSLRGRCWLLLIRLKRRRAQVG